MSQLSDTLAAVAAQQDAQDAAFVTFKADLDKALADLAAKIAAGGVSQADLDALTALGARIDANTGKLTDLDTEVKTADQ